MHAHHDFDFVAASFSRAPLTFPGNANLLIGVLRHDVETHGVVRLL